MDLDLLEAITDILACTGDVSLGGSVPDAACPSVDQPYVDWLDGVLRTLEDARRKGRRVYFKLSARDTAFAERAVFERWLDWSPVEVGVVLPLDPSVPRGDPR